MASSTPGAITLAEGNGSLAMAPATRARKRQRPSGVIRRNTKVEVGLEMGPFVAEPCSGDAATVAAMACLATKAARAA
eukprot:CAMPEP_0115316094 /NCGR_PEP_ID=MMETSP0270-20121206/77936_1 /TAXON_ID=71861 /ORGANISM="Scrippsiella trochoidea, Strain CCMP3099" /LENGTH=77 /DNA_ID=CAMNT_0002735471 /DNA_START=250 /DNA_END=480 /DNA_ORIENTATION=+